MGTDNTLEVEEPADPPPICGFKPEDLTTTTATSPTATAQSSFVDLSSLKELNRKDAGRLAHTLSVETVQLVARTDAHNGLTTAEAAERLREDGPNKVKSAKGLSIWEILLRQVSNSLTVVLLATMGISLGIQDWIEGGVIAAVIALNIIVGFIQDYGAEQKIMALKAMSAPHAKVVRNGILDTVKTELLVVGDVVHLTSGDIAPADMRLIDTVSMKADESMLTGESVTVSKKHLEIYADMDMPAGDRRNMVFSGTNVVQGRGHGVVVATGMFTEMGKIADLLRDKDHNAKSQTWSQKVRKLVITRIKKILGLDGTPLTVSLSKFALLLFALAIILLLIVFAVNKFQVADDVLIYGICVAVAVIPESLIAVLTLSVAAGTKTMAKGNVIVRQLSSLEAVGGVTNICSDKTGTLTQGKMIARKAWIRDGSTISVDDVSDPYDPSSGTCSVKGTDTPSLGDNTTLGRLLETVSVCNLATISQGENGKWKPQGEPTEAALQVLATRFGFGKSKVLAHGDMELVTEFPFDSVQKRMTVVYRNRQTGAITAFTKGATEVILNHVSENEQEKERIRAMAEDLASDGLRVLSIASRVLDPLRAQILDLSDRPWVEKDLEFIGLVGIQDPPRKESASAVARCQEAGITVHMLTGDHKATATAIAHDVGIINKHTLAENQKMAVMTASDFDRLTDSEIDQLPSLPLVVARCSPTTKVRMVDALHRRGAFCVMTGDGVNDSPALKRADVGIAMGLNGSDVAKEVAHMILTDDNFASIVKAVEEGRRLFANIQKFLMHLLISNIAQVFLLLIGLAFKDTEGKAVFPLSPIEILWVNLITSSFLALGLGLEEAQHDIMDHPPHDLKVGVFTRELIVDKMVYGTIMGGLCLAAFTSVAYGVGGGQLGHECNEGWNDSCGLAFRARGTTYATLTFLLLATAWEVKHFKRSLFNLDPVRFPGKLSVFPALWHNRFLFWAVTAGFVLCFPIIYLPYVNRLVFKHTAITWEWGIVFACLIAYVALVECWKAIKRRYNIGNQTQKPKVNEADHV